MSNGLTVINQLHPKAYSFKSQQQLNSGINLPAGTHAGIMAQDLETVLPNLVSTVVQPAKFYNAGKQINPSLSIKGVIYIELNP